LTKVPAYDDVSLVVYLPWTM